MAVCGGVTLPTPWALALSLVTAALDGEGIVEERLRQAGAAELADRSILAETTAALVSVADGVLGLWAQLLRIDIADRHSLLDRLPTEFRDRPYVRLLHAKLVAGGQDVYEWAGVERATPGFAGGHLLGELVAFVKLALREVEELGPPAWRGNGRWWQWIAQAITCHLDGGEPLTVRGDSPSN